MEDNRNHVFDAIYEEICKVYNPHIYGQCNQINSTLAVVLKKMGYKPQLLVGYVETNNPIIEDDGSEHFTVNHVFVLIEDQIYDFAASQMQNLLDVNFNDSYFIGKNDSYRRDHQLPIATWANKDLVNKILEKI